MYIMIIIRVMVIDGAARKGEDRIKKVTGYDPFLVPFALGLCEYVTNTKRIFFKAKHK